MTYMYCRGGCSWEIDPDLHPTGICPDCEAREARKNEEAWREVPPDDER